MWHCVQAIQIVASLGIQLLALWAVRVLEGGEAVAAWAGARMTMQREGVVRRVELTPVSITATVSTTTCVSCVQALLRSQLLAISVCMAPDSRSSAGRIQIRDSAARSRAEQAECTCF